MSTQSTSSATRTANQQASGVGHPPPAASAKKGGLFSRLFSRSSQPATQPTPLDQRSVSIIQRVSQPPVAPNGAGAAAPEPVLEFQGQPNSSNSSRAASPVPQTTPVGVKNPTLLRLQQLLSGFTNLLVAQLKDHLLSPLSPLLSEIAHSSLLPTLVSFSNEITQLTKSAEQFPDSYLLLLRKHDITHPIKKGLRKPLLSLISAHDLESSEKLFGKLKQELPKNCKKVILDQGEKITDYTTPIIDWLFNTNHEESIIDFSDPNLDEETLKEVFEICIDLLQKERAQQLAELTSHHIESEIFPTLQSEIAKDLPIICTHLSNRLVLLFAHISPKTFTTEFDRIISRISGAAYAMTYARRIYAKLDQNKQSPEAMLEIFSSPQRLLEEIYLEQPDLKQDAQKPQELLAQLTAVCHQVTRQMLEIRADAVVTDLEQYRQNITEKRCDVVADRLYQLLLPEGFQPILNELNLINALRDKLESMKLAVLPFLTPQLEKSLSKQIEHVTTQLNDLIIQVVHNSVRKGLTKGVGASHDVLSPDSLNKILAKNVFPSVTSTLCEQMIKATIEAELKQEGIPFSSRAATTIKSLAYNWTVGWVAPSSPATPPQETSAEYVKKLSPQFLQLITSDDPRVETDLLEEINALTSKNCHDFKWTREISFDKFREMGKPIIEGIKKHLRTAKSLGLGMSLEQVKSVILSYLNGDTPEELCFKLYKEYFCRPEVAGRLHQFLAAEMDKAGLQQIGQDILLGLYKEISSRDPEWRKTIPFNDFVSLTQPVLIHIARYLKGISLLSVNAIPTHVANAYDRQKNVSVEKLYTVLFKNILKLADFDQIAEENPSWLQRMLADHGKKISSVDQLLSSEFIQYQLSNMLLSHLFHDVRSTHYTLLEAIVKGLEGTLLKEEFVEEIFTSDGDLKELKASEAALSASPDFDNEDLDGSQKRLESFKLQQRIQKLKLAQAERARETSVFARGVFEEMRKTTQILYDFIMFKANATAGLPLASTLKLILTNDSKCLYTIFERGIAHLFGQKIFCQNHIMLASDIVVGLLEGASDSIKQSETQKTSKTGKSPAKAIESPSRASASSQLDTRDKV